MAVTAGHLCWPMEFDDVVRARRMVRRFTDEPVTPEVVDELIDLARRAPSAGNTQGADFVVLEGAAQTSQYWDLTLPASARDGFPWPGLLDAPVLIIPVGDSSRYLDRYAEPDKARTGLGGDREAWAVPYWQIDCAMAAMTLLHAAVDRGLGALFFGIFAHTPAVKAHFGIPEAADPIGTIALGHPHPDGRPSRSTRRTRRPLDEVIHRGGWLPSPQ